MVPQLLFCSTDRIRAILLTMAPIACVDKVLKENLIEN